MTERTAAEIVEGVIRKFDEDLNRAGFRTRSSGIGPDDWEWSGRVGPGQEPVTVKLPDGFPFAVPAVVLRNRSGASDWHQTTGGTLCLWDSHSQGDLPWLDVPKLLRRIEEWIANADAGWLDDAPQLDLEAYNTPRIRVRGHRATVPLLVIDEWEDIAGHWFRTKQPLETGLIQLVGAHRPAPLPPRSRTSRTRRRARQGGDPHAERFLDGLAVDLGEMSTPLVSDEQLFQALGKEAGRIYELLAAARTVIIAARYSRSGDKGLIGFWLAPDGDKYSRECFHVVERIPSQHRRAGRHATVLQDRRVSVIGAGSIGSYLADLLHRSGVRDLVVHDSDHLLPGNLVRHAASADFVGAPKTEAIRDTAARRDPSWPIQTEGALAGLDEAVQLLRERDLVVDCTGDRLIWQLMLAAADIAGVSFLHVMVEGHGQFGRVDICPPLDGCEPLSPNQVLPVLLTEREGGCGDPVSPTPPTAVIETAAMGARFAVRMLAGEAVPPAGESRELFLVIP